MRRRRWGPWEDHHLVFAYRQVPTKTIARELRRTLSAVKLRASHLGIARLRPRWTTAEDEVLRRRYREISVSQICVRLRRPKAGAYARAFRLGLRKVARKKRRVWSSAEDEILREKYGMVRPLVLAKELKRTRGSIWHRAKRIGLFAQLGSGEYVRRQALPRTAKPFTGLHDEGHRGYVAGIIDGEGSIERPPRVKLSVTTTTRRLAYRLQEIAGGSVSGPYLYHKTKIFGSRRCRVKPQYHWNYSSRAHVYLLLKAIHPYLVVKAREAERAVEYLESRLGWSGDGKDAT